MSVTTVAVQPDDPDPQVIERAGAVLRRGGLVAFPTETVYGLGAHAADEAAVRAIFEGKGRPATDPLIVHVHSIAAARQVAARWADFAEELAHTFWPGPLTLVLPRSDAIPPMVSAGRSSVAIRVPAHPVALALLRAADVPVAAPSANRFGRVSPTTARHVEEELSGVYDLLLDAGPTPLGVESTVVDLTGGSPRMLRPGGIPLEDLLRILPDVEHEERTVVAIDTSAAAPGEFLRHYAPTTPLVLIEGPPELRTRLADGLAGRGVHAEELRLPDLPELAARELYASLRAADRSGAQILLVTTVDPAGVGRAVNDRLFRAAHGRVVVDASAGTVGRLAALVEGTASSGGAETRG